MKPSEAHEKLNDLRGAAINAKARYVALACLYEELITRLDNGETLVAVGEHAREALESDVNDEDAAPFAGLVKPTRLFPGDRALNAEDVEVKGGVAYVQDEAPYGRKADGTPKKAPGRKKVDVEPAMKAGVLPEEAVRLPAAPKPHVAPLTSPLTDELRAKFERTLGAAPMTAESIARMSWAVDLDAERITALLCEAPETFIRWTDTGPQRYELWGLPHQFDRVVGMLTLQCSKAERAQYTSAALGCSVSAALAAWARLDPEPS